MQHTYQSAFWHCYQLSKMIWWISEQIATHLTRTVSSRFALLIFANRMRQILDEEIKDGYTHERIFACPSRSRRPSCIWNNAKQYWIVSCALAQ